MACLLSCLIRLPGARACGDVLPPHLLWPPVSRGGKKPGTFLVDVAFKQDFEPAPHRPAVCIHCPPPLVKGTLCASRTFLLYSVPGLTRCPLDSMCAECTPPPRCRGGQQGRARSCGGADPDDVGQSGLGRFALLNRLPMFDNSKSPRPPFLPCMPASFVDGIVPSSKSGILRASAYSCWSGKAPHRGRADAIRRPWRGYGCHFRASRPSSYGRRPARYRPWMRICRPRQTAVRAWLAALAAACMPSCRAPADRHL